MIQELKENDITLGYQFIIHLRYMNVGLKKGVEFLLWKTKINKNGRRKELNFYFGKQK